MNNARHLFVAVMGSWMGLAGVEHGIGEFLQGNIAPGGLLILSWPDSPFFSSLSGEPAMTILPSLLLTGALAVVVSLASIAWAVFFSRCKYGALGLMLLAVPLLLFGGGFFPPVLLALVGAAALGLHRPPAAKPAGRLNRLIGKAWGWILAACCLVWLALLPGVPALAYFFEVENASLTLAVMAAAFSLLALAWWSSLQHDRFSSESPH